MFSLLRPYKLFYKYCGKRWESVFVGLSGGIDSAVSAYLLKKQGYDVKGVFMKNWSIEEETGRSVCPAKDDYIAAREVANYLHIPLDTYDFEKEYWTNVFEVCLDSYSRGMTPNPDVLCNRYIKFDKFYSRCVSEGADYVATGHYCRINYEQMISSYSKGVELLRGVDPSKDQSYFLSQINSSTLSRIIFPVGGLSKKEVKQLANELKFPNATKKESMGICFIGERNMKNFLSEYLTTSPGDIRSVDGRRMGTHEGLLYYTIGQGIRLSNQLEKYYVCEKRVDTNEIIVCPATHPALFKHEVIVGTKETVWMNPETPYLLSYQCHQNNSFPIQCQLRYQNVYFYKEVHYDINSEEIRVRSLQPMRAVTKGQICVFYDGDVCLGGGEILR